MILIFEGVDKSGKSTLIEKIPGLYIKNKFIPEKGNPKSVEAYKDIQKDLATFLFAHDKEKYNIILDRSYFSEIVYSNILRDYEALDDKFYQFLSGIYRNMHCILFFCTAPLEKLWERIVINDDLDDVKNKENLEFAIERYERIFDHKRLRISRRVLNTFDKNVDECLEDINYVIDRLGGNQKQVIKNREMEEKKRWI